MHRLRSVLQRQNLVSAAATTSVYDVAVSMSEGHIGAIPILDGETLVGIFSERDLMTRVVVPGLDPKGTPVGDVMTRDVVTANLEEHVDFCLEKMQRVGCRHLPVMVDGRVVAVMSMRDLLRDEVAEQDHEIRHLRAYLHQTPV